MAHKQKKETFLLVSLKEDKAKELAQVISNESCRKILDYLATVEDATETKISAEMNIPISTVHYNLTHLEKGGLVEVEEFHYSEKGKEVNHYKLANKFIIISPKSTESIREKLTKKLGSILPVALAAVCIGGIIQFITSAKNNMFRAAEMATEGIAASAPSALQKGAALDKAAPLIAEESAQVLDTAAGSASQAAQPAVQAAETATQTAIQSSHSFIQTITQSIINYPGYWFMGGVIVFVIIYMVWNAVKRE